MVTRPEIFISNDNYSNVDEDRSSPTPSVSSKVSCFSQRMASLDRKVNLPRREEKMKLAVGRGRGFDQSFSHQEQMMIRQETNDEDRISPVPSMTDTSLWNQTNDQTIN